MEVLAKVQVNDENTGKLLFKDKVIFTCEECKTRKDFIHAHGGEVSEYMDSLISCEMKARGGAVCCFDLVVLETEYEEEEGEDVGNGSEEDGNEDESGTEYERIERVEL